MLLKAYFDGCTEPKNPGGHCGYGAVILDGDKRLWEFSGYIAPSPQTSNNVGEYTGLLSILQHLKAQGLQRKSITIYGDSKLVICQMWADPNTGRPWRMNGGFYLPTAMKAQKLLREFPYAIGRWIPREENFLADELSKRELIKRGVEFRIQPTEKAVRT